MGDQAVRRAPAVPAADWISGLPAAGRFVLHGGAAARAAAESVWGVAFSEAACRAHAQAARATLWMGPDEYLLLESDARDAAAGLPADGAAPNTFDALERAMAGIPHALVDISHRQFTLEVHGPHAETILSGACPLDLDLAEFPVGMCTRTVLAKADILLWRTRPDAFHLEIWRSFAGYVFGVLTEIAAEFHPTG